MNNRKSGFTLIELMIVIAIIGVLSSIILGGLRSSVTVKARDTKRVAELKSITTALEMYYIDHNSYLGCWESGYPGGCDLVDYMVPGTQADSSLDGTFMHFLTTGKYISRDPIDPINTLSSGHFYIYTAPGDFPPGSGTMYSYVLGTMLEDPNSPLLKASLTRGDPSFGGFYVVGVK